MPWKRDGSTARKMRCGKLSLCGKSGSAGGWSFCATLDEARASLARGEGRPINEESMRELSAGVRERGRARLIAELAQTR
jgi:hypothetical protein